MNVRNVTTVVIIGVSWALAQAVEAQTCVFTEPPTPNCGSPRVIPGWEGQHVVLMDAATAGGTASRCGVPTGHEVWFEVIPDVSGPMTISTCHPSTSFDTVIQAFAGSDCAMMIQMECNDDVPDVECDNGCSGRGSKLTFAVEAGIPYKFVVGSYNNNSDVCSPLCLGVIVTIGHPCGEAPTNLACSLAREMPGTPGTYYAEADVTDALFLDGVEPSPDPACIQVGIGHTVWYKTTPTQDGRISFSTCDPLTNYDTVLQAYAGDCTGPLIYLACSDDEPEMPACRVGCDPTDTRG